MGGGGLDCACAKMWMKAAASSLHLSPTSIADAPVAQYVNFVSSLLARASREATLMYGFSMMNSMALPSNTLDSGSRYA